jgi:serine phosphatase RsbU (regulator of sigma subunit)/Tfp pilus assembly protein PilF
MHPLRSILLIVALCLVSAGFQFAQDSPQVDSLITLLETARGENRVEILFKLAEDESLTVNDRIDYAEKAVELAIQLDKVELLSEAHIKLGYIYYTEDEYDKALDSFRKAYDESREAGYSDGMANALIRIGRVYSYTGDTGAALESFNQAKDLATKEKNHTIQGRTLYYIGDLYRKNAEYDPALVYFEQARAQAEEANDMEFLPTIIGDAGLVMYLKGDFQQSIKAYEEAAEMFIEAGDKLDAAKMYVRLGTANLQRAEYDVALNFLQKALPIFEELNYVPGISAVTNNLGVIYFTQGLFDKALEVHLSHLKKSRERGDKKEIANALHNIGSVYSRFAEDSLKTLFGENFQDSVKIENTDKYLKLFSDAQHYYSESIKVWEELGEEGGIIRGNINMGINYLYSGKPALALGPLQRALELNREVSNKADEATIYLLLGQVYLAFGNYGTSESYLHRALELATNADTKEILMEIYRKLSEVSEKQSDYVSALQYYKMYFSNYDTINQEKRSKAIADMQVKYETDAKEKENALLIAQSEAAAARLTKTRAILIITIIAIGVFIVMMIQLVRQNNLKKKANRELEQKNKLITEQKKEITDSIQYASRIQNAMLPPGDYLDNLMPERFIIYMPRDIVSGDYYYITERGGQIICVTADCTGHGVPGAFMSLLGIAFLNQILSKHAELHTDLILEELRSQVIASLHQTGKEGESQDGMDVALFILDPKTRKLEFSGANNSLLVYRNGDLIEARADKMPIGIHTRYKEAFTRHKLDLKKGDMLYTFSDGYPDQFGGPNQKKFMIKNFKKMLQEIHMKPMAEQKKIVQQTLRDWMASADQVDDILVIGVRI